MTFETRPSGRAVDELRNIVLTREYTKHAEGSVLIECGDTKVICTASIEDKVPGFLKGKGQGWMTAEYGMLPRSTHTRMDREAARGKQSGRTQEIQRLIGRSLRAAFDLEAFGERTLNIDCDVIQADGGTRTASITGAMVAAYDQHAAYLKTLGRRDGRGVRRVFEAGGARRYRRGAGQAFCGGDFGRRVQGHAGAGSGLC